jgi:hypothetical protein
MAPKRKQKSKKEVCPPTPEAMTEISSTDEEMNNVELPGEEQPWHPPTVQDRPTRIPTPDLSRAHTLTSVDEAWLRGTSFASSATGSNFVMDACGLNLAESGRYKRTLRIPEYSFDLGDFATWFFKYRTSFLADGERSAKYGLCISVAPEFAEAAWRRFPEGTTASFDDLAVVVAHLIYAESPRDISTTISHLWIGQDGIRGLPHLVQRVIFLVKAVDVNALLSNLAWTI